MGKSENRERERRENGKEKEKDIKQMRREINGKQGMETLGEG